MELEKIGNIINEIESRYEVDKWEVDGVKIWPFIRVENYSLLSYKALQSDVPSTRSWSYVGIVLMSKWRKVMAEIIDMRMNAKSAKADVVLMSDGVSFAKVNNHWYEKFCDPIYDYYSSNNTSSIRFDPSHRFLTPRYSPSKFIQTSMDNIIIGSLLKSKLFKQTSTNEYWGDYESFIQDDFVRQNLINIPAKNAIRARVNKINRLRVHYNKELKKVNPKIAFVVCYYGDAVMAFLLACKDLGIKTVDLQHGVQGDFHLAYGLWTKVPVNGYESLPDYFWVWSESEKNTIDKWNKHIATHKAVVCGNLFLEQWRDETSLTVQECDLICKRSQKMPGKPSVLLTLSPEVEELMKETWAVVKKTQNIYNWNIRLHPSMLNRKKLVLRDLEAKGIINFELTICSSLPLYAILRNVDLHVTAQSSTVLEACVFGVKSIITSNYGASLYKNEIEAGDAFFLDSENEIKMRINELLGKTVYRERRESENKNNAFEVFNKIVGLTT